MVGHRSAAAQVTRGQRWLQYGHTRIDGEGEPHVTTHGPLARHRSSRHARSADYFRAAERRHRRHARQDPHCGRNFTVVEALAIDGGRIVARGTSPRSTQLAGPNTKSSTSRAPPSFRASSTTTCTLRAAVEALAPAGPLRRGRLPQGSAGDSRRQGGEPAGGRLDDGAGRLDAAAVRRRAGRLHPRGTRPRRAEESAVRAGGLQRRLLQHARAEGRGARPGGRRPAPRAGLGRSSRPTRSTTRCRKRRPRSSNRTSRTSCRS